MTQNTDTSKLLYLPIEIWSREFHAKSLLALNAVNKGWSVIIGPKSHLERRLNRLPSGIVWQSGFHNNFAAHYTKIRSMGHKIVANDEEGLVI